MRSMNGKDVELAVADMVSVLTPQVDQDWQVHAGSLDWTCWETAAHVGHDLLAYATQITSRATSAYLPCSLLIDAPASPRQVLEVITASGALLAAAINTAGPAVRARHWGPTDPGGFAALGVNEVLVHTYDVALGLDVPWCPAKAACAAVLNRLFPEAPDGDPVQVLLWCTGRVALADRPRRGSWILKASLDCVEPSGRA